MLNAIASFFDNIKDFILGFLPNSPFRDALTHFSNLPALGYLNWFFPISECLRIMSGWLACIALYYIFSFAKSWVNKLNGGAE